MDEMNPLEPSKIIVPGAEPEAGTPEAALEKLAAVAGPNFDREQMAKLKAKLAKVDPAAIAETPTEGPVAEQATPAPGSAGRPLTGRDIDWSEYNLDFNVAHLYKDAVYRETPQGPKWVTMVTDFVSTTKDFRNYDKRVNVPGTSDGKETEALNLGRYLNDMVNGREAWKIAAVMPSGSQCGLLLERQVPIILPDPQPLKKSEEVAAPSDPALKEIEDAALAFVAEQNPVDKEAEVGDDTTAAPSAEDIGLRAIEKGTVEHEQALAQVDETTGAVQARSGAVVQRALEVAAPLTVAAPTAGVIQPEPVVGVDIARSNLNPEGKVAAAGFTAAQDLLRALSDPAFRAQLPTEE